MKRKILSVTLITLSSLMLILSLVGIGAIWISKNTLTEEIVSQLQAVDSGHDRSRICFCDSQV